MELQGRNHRCHWESGLVDRSLGDWLGLPQSAEVGVECKQLQRIILPVWGRHGFDGIVCGKEACRGPGTRNRLENDNCRSSTGIRSLIN